MERLTLETARRGTVIQDGENNELYLILKCDTDKNYLQCLDKTFQSIDLGLDWINNYYIYDRIDMTMLLLSMCNNSTEEINQLKFYYCESEDDYFLGQRVDNFYYAKYNKDCGEFVWCMSKFLPWGQDITLKDTLWKEHTYPSEPVEIDFIEWLKGFTNKYFGKNSTEVSDAVNEDSTEWIVIDDAYDSFGNLYPTEWCCKSCGYTTNTIIDYVFCPSCGRKVLR